jgi:tryptophan synthase alpha chain
MNRLTDYLKNKNKDLITVFYTAGYPKLNDTIEIAITLAQKGIDFLEIGMPFSDPVADGPTIQASSTQALANGMNLHILLNQLVEIRKETDIPIVLMGYYNPIYKFGAEDFFRKAKESGADGFILPDLPLEVFDMNYKTLFEELDLSWIPLVTPLTYVDRLTLFDSRANSFIYAVSTAGITGARTGFSEESLAYFERLSRTKLKHPVLVGFGISDRTSIEKVNQYLNGVIIGSAFIQSLSSNDDLSNAIDNFIQKIR